MVVFVFGLPGSGKSFFAMRLAGVISAAYINSDQVRNDLLGNKTYSDKEKRLVYDSMLERMQNAIKQNRNIVLDGTFYKEDIRKKFMEAAKIRTAIYLIEVNADEILIKERLKKKRTDSDADYGVYKKIKQQWEPLVEPHLVLKSTNDNIEDMLQQASNYFQIKQ